MVDSFEDQSLSEYTGDTGGMSIVSDAAAPDGSYVLSGTGSSALEVLSSSGLPAYPSRGDVFEFHVRPVNTSVVSDLIFFDDGSEYYRLSIEGDGELKLFHSTNGRILYDSSCSWTIDDWNRVVVDTSVTDDITITAYDASETEISNSTVTDGTISGSGIGWRHNATSTPAETRFDALTIGSDGSGGGGGGGPSATVIDSFEDQSLSEYSGADQGDWSFATSPVYDGSYSLQTGGGSILDDIYSTSGLANYYAKGDGTLKLYVRWNTVDGVPFFRFCAADNNNSYFIRFDTQNSDISVERESSGSTTELDAAAVTWTAGVWYEVAITYDDGTLGGADGDISVTLTEDPDGSATQAATLSANDLEHDANSGIGFLQQSYGSGNYTYFDYVHKTS